MVTRLVSEQGVSVVVHTSNVMIKINRRQYGAISSEVEIDVRVHRVDSKQAGWVISRSAMGHGRMADPRIEFLQMEIYQVGKEFAVMMTILEVITRMCLTTLH